MDVKGYVVSLIGRSVRVLNVCHRPRSDEYWTMAKTAGLGVVLIGLAGFVITLVFSVL